ncbi:hypothetical protein ACFFQW_14475 [Umezawaea endophytica]|uniref:Uncharacterized protein n=1 Tax=Umezawaea endophytica TaxID=1654476 RepID=A0A9X2ZZV4_9PSEU|nr:hypothetical protein [Umezawaea endophytica]MCS7477869.1 hypothetical protein [Umezawaea endophytica]
MRASLSHAKSAISIVLNGVDVHEWVQANIPARDAQGGLRWCGVLVEEFGEHLTAATNLPRQVG